MAKELKKINFNVDLLGRDGAVMSQPKTKNGKYVFKQEETVGEDGEKKMTAVIDSETISVRNVVVDALLGRYDEDKDTPPSEILKRTKLADYVMTRSTGKYNDEEINLIEKYVAKSVTNFIALLRVQQLIYGDLNEGEVVDDSDKEKAA